MSSNQRISRKPVGSDGSPLSPDPQISLQDGQSELSVRRGGIHWRASTIMVTSLLSGMLLALGHHLFYNHLDGKAVATSQHVIKGVTPQQLNLTLGTLFAFLIHALLSVAVTTSYTQIVWRAVKKRATSLSKIDTLFHASSNFWSLLFLPTWRKYPILFLVGLTIWLIPIASVITPAALTVTIAPVTPVQTQITRVPRVDFTSLNFANVQTGQGVWFYTRPRFAVDKVVAATAAQGYILSIPPDHPNSSYTLDFPGPSIECTELQGSVLDDIQKNIQAAVAIDNCSTSFAYIGWTPSYIKTGNAGSEFSLSTLPFLLSENKSYYSLNDASLGPLPVGVFNATVPPASFYAAIYHNMEDEIDWNNQGSECQPTFDENSRFQNITAFQCVLQNSSYHTTFSYTGGEQTINITVDEQPYNTVSPIYVLPDDNPWSPLANYTQNATTDQIFQGYRPNVVETLAYQSIMASFGSIMVGTIFNSFNTLGGLVSNGTSVMSTVIGETEELVWLNGYPSAKILGHEFTLQESIADPTEGTIMWNGVDTAEDFQSSLPFKTAIESLFQNITIGMMSSKLLQPNISSPYAPPPTNVTLHNFQTVYSYSRSRLWIAYGLAILLSIISVIIGLSSMLSSGIAYTNLFSTILRAARYANMGTSLMPEDADGKDPLPEYLAAASVSFDGDWERREKRGISWFSDMKSPGVSSRLLAE